MAQAQKNSQLLGNMQALERAFKSVGETSKAKV
jgi:hypothetical protein